MKDHDNRPPRTPSARVGMHRYACNLYRKPMAMPVTGPGQVTLILGELPSGDPLTITVTDLAYLDLLESAIQAARAGGVIEAGMTLGATL